MSPPRLVVALDVHDPARAVRLVENLTSLGVLFKVGYEAFYGYGAQQPPQPPPWAERPRFDELSKPVQPPDLR